MFPSAGDVPYNERQRLRAKSHQILRNSPHAVALVDALTQRMAPRTLAPEPLVLDESGNEDLDLRKRIKFLWDQWSDKACTQGQLNINELFQQGARETIAAGEVLYYKRRHSVATAKKYGLDVPLTVDVIEAERLDELRNSWGPMPEGENEIYEGVVLSADGLGRRVGYYLRRGNPYHMISLSDWDSYFVPASEVIHLIYPNPLRPSSIRGYPALSPVLDTFSMITDMQLNELIASIVASTFSMWIQKNPVSTFNFPKSQALPQHDEDGVRRLFGKPGTVPILRTGEELKGFNPNRPNATTDAFCTFLLRGIATAFPVKPSVLTGDFRASSYASEASAEIENFPRRDALCQYFIQGVCEPIYREFIGAALLAGLLPGVDPESAEERMLFRANWPQMQIRSINPDRDVKASLMSALSCLSSFKKESQKWGTPIEENVAELGEFIQLCESKKVPLEVILRILEVPLAPVVTNPDEENTEDAA